MSNLTEESIAFAQDLLATELFERDIQIVLNGMSMALSALAMGTLIETYGISREEANILAHEEIRKKFEMQEAFIKTQLQPQPQPQP